MFECVVIFMKANMSESFIEHWNIVRISRVNNILNPQDVPDDESFEEKHTKASLEYLLKKGQLMHHDIAEELIFYPEVSFLFFFLAKIILLG